MHSFYLNCWAPSLKQYLKIAELKMYQLEIISKYILNEDDESLNQTFNDILQENLEQKELFYKLTRYDKWFLLLFLRASSVSGQLFYRAKNTDESTCALTFNLFDILTDLSELVIPTIENLKLDDIEITFTPVKDLYSVNYLHESIFKIRINNKDFYPGAFEQNTKERFFNTIDRTAITEIYNHLRKYDQAFESVYIINNDKQLKDFYSVKFNLLGNTLFGFLKSTFIPQAQSLYKKKYTLLTKLNLDSNTINNLTPSECDIYLNIFNTEKESATTDSSVSL
jgi:hypothetical protein